MSFSQRMRLRRRGHPGRFAVFLLVVPCLVAVAGWVVKSLWNAVLVEALNAKPLSFWQALGLLLLCRILLGHWGPRGGRGRWARGGGGGRWAGGDDAAGPARELHARWRNMTPEQREKIRDHWKARCSARNKRADGDESKDAG